MNVEQDAWRDNGATCPVCGCDVLIGKGRLFGECLLCGRLRYEELPKLIVEEVPPHDGPCNHSRSVAPYCQLNRR